MCSPVENLTFSINSITSTKGDYVRYQGVMSLVFTTSWAVARPPLNHFPAVPQWGRGGPHRGGRAPCAGPGLPAPTGRAQAGDARALRPVEGTLTSRSQARARVPPGRGAGKRRFAAKPSLGIGRSRRLRQEPGGWRRLRLLKLNCAASLIGGNDCSFNN